MKLFSTALALAAASFLLTACADYSMNMINRAQPVGSPFTKYLAMEYRDLANQSQGSFLNFGASDAKYFARKGMAAVDGIAVEPESIDRWSVTDNDAELAQARAELIMALNNRGRELAPDKAALAQSRFDCWAMGQGKLGNGGAACKRQFHAVMPVLIAETNKVSAPAPAPAPQPSYAASSLAAPAVTAEEFPAPVGASAKGETVPLQQAAFMVFFDWNKYNLSGGAKSVLNAVTQEVQGRKDVKNIVIVGHTDTSGSEKYNNKLSLKRANAVRNDLITHGLPAQQIRVEGRGEKDLLVKTPDNVREPANRRAQITLE